MDINEAKIEMAKHAALLTSKGNMILPRMDFVRHFTMLCTAAGIPFDRKQLEDEHWIESIACQYM